MVFCFPPVVASDYSPRRVQVLGHSGQIGGIVLGVRGRSTGWTLAHWVGGIDALCRNSPGETYVIRKEKHLNSCTLKSYNRLNVPALAPVPVLSGIPQDEIPSSPVPV